MYLSVIDVVPQEGYKLLLTFENGEKKVLEMNDYLAHGEFRELKDERIFNTVHIAFDSIEWSNGIDLDPEELYQSSVSII
jgi:hypothetical protein